MEKKDIKEENYRYIKTESEICITAHYTLQQLY